MQHINWKGYRIAAWIGQALRMITLVGSYQTTVVT